jgi:hypothetical protein
VPQWTGATPVCPEAIERLYIDTKAFNTYRTPVVLVRNPRLSFMKRARSSIDDASHTSPASSLEASAALAVFGTTQGQIQHRISTSWFSETVHTRSFVVWNQRETATTSIIQECERASRRPVQSRL